MSKYYKSEDIIELITACEWRMTLAKERHGEGFVDYSKQVLDVDELNKRLYDLPTIEVSEDCISREYILGEAFASDEYNRETKSFDLPVVSVRDIEDAPSVVPTVRKNRTTQLFPKWNKLERSSE